MDRPQGLARRGGLRIRTLEEVHADGGAGGGAFIDEGLPGERFSPEWQLVVCSWARAGGRPRSRRGNAFIGDWATQTLLALFGDSQGQGFAQVKKPVLNLYTMLAILGDHRLRAPGEARDNLGVLATRRGEEQMAVLLYHVADDPAARDAAAIRLRLGGVPFQKGMLARYRIDDLQEHPYRLWQQMGSPPAPTRELT